MKYKKVVQGDGSVTVYLCDTYWGGLSLDLLTFTYCYYFSLKAYYASFPRKDE